MNNQKLLLICFILFQVFVMFQSCQETSIPLYFLFPPGEKYQDAEFTQEITTLIEGSPLWNISIIELASSSNGEIYILTDDGTTGRYDGTSFYKLNQTGVSSIGYSSGGKIIAGGNEWICELSSNCTQQTVSGSVLDIRPCFDNGAIILTDQAVYHRSSTGSLSMLMNSASTQTKIAALYDEILAIVDSGSLVLYDWNGSLLSNPPALSEVIINDAIFGGDGKLYLASNQGLGIIESDLSNVLFITGEDGLAKNNILALENGLENNLLLIYDLGAGWRSGENEIYYQSKYYMPDNYPTSIAESSSGDLYIGTLSGLSIIKREELTLEEKAVHYDELAQTYHNRFGYIARCSNMSQPMDLETCQNYDDDNDGQWTGMYLASQSFAYGATGSATYRENARQSMEALLLLENVTGADGFFARSVVPIDECEAKMAGEGEWHPAEDGVWCWKGDTSADEYVGHIFGLSIYFDLVATGAERERIAKSLALMHDRFIDNGFLLIDIDGHPTEHGRFDPDFITSSLAQFGDGALNAAKILGGLKATYHMTGEKRFLDAFNLLCHDYNYKENVRRMVEIETAWHINHDSDEMCFLALYSLMRYETDGKLMQLWREGMKGMWQTQRPERNPEFNFIYAGTMNTPYYDLENSIQTLKEIPYWLFHWELDLSHRADIELSPDLDRFGNPQTTFVYPYNERYVMKWNSNPYALYQGGDGRYHESPMYWLLAYWMGRYLRIIH